MYVSAHPVAQALQSVADDPNRLTLSQISEEHIGQKITLIGMLTGLRRVVTKKNDTMLIAMVEDLDSSIEMVAFPKVYEKFASFWQDDNIVAITAKVEHRRDSLQLVCDSVSAYTEVVAAAPVEVAAYAGFSDGGLAYDDDAPPPDDPAWSSLDVLTAAASSAPSAAANGNGHSGGHDHADDGYTRAGNGHASNGAQMQNEPTKPAAPSTPTAPAGAAQPMTIIKPRQRITIAKRAEPEPNAPALSGPQQVLHIQFPRTENDRADVRRMQEVARHLERFRGDQRVLLYVPKDDVMVVLEATEGVTPSQELIMLLSELLGAEAVRVGQAA
jgi:DNA polymerase-3 subunit alpha